MPLTPEQKKIFDETLQQQDQPEEREPSSGELFVKGVGRGLASDAVGAARLAGRITDPTASIRASLGIPSLGELAYKYAPGVKTGVDAVTGFADAETPTTSEWAGKMVGELAPMVALPETAPELMFGRTVQGAATRLMGNAAAPMFKRGLGWTPTSPWPKWAGDIASNAPRGAAGGAVADPEHPETGAIVGALSGIIPSIGGRFMQTKAGHIAGAFIPLTGLGYILHSHGFPLWHMLEDVGISAAVAKALGFQLKHSSGITGKITSGAGTVMDKIGGAVQSQEHRLGGAAGYGAGKATKPEDDDGQ